MRQRRWLAVLLLLTVVCSNHAATFVVDSLSDFDDDSLTDNLCSTVVVENGMLRFRCSLRGAIQQANATAGEDRIEFAVAGRITLTGSDRPLPSISDVVTVDGSTAPGAPAIDGVSPAAPVIIIDGGNLVSPGDGWWGLDVLGSAQGSRIFNLAVVNVPGVAMALEGEANWASGCWLGVDPSTGEVAANADGVTFRDALNNVLGRSVANLGRGNVISGNRATAVFGALNFGVIRGNRIGVDAGGTSALPNGGNGLFLQGNSNDVGQADPADSERNVIAANGLGNIRVEGDGNLIRGNTVGCGVADGLPGPGPGIRVSGQDNVIGGAADSGNAVCGQQDTGVWADDAPRVRITHNRVLDGQGRGMIVRALEPEVEDNQISGNADIGVFFVSVTRGRLADNEITGNGDGIRFNNNTRDSTALNNTLSQNSRGLQVSGENNTVSQNQISLSRSEGVDLFSAMGTLVIGNRISGTDGPAVLVRLDSLENEISENSIFGESAPAIDLEGDGPSPNDPGDADMGSNNLQNTPELSLISFVPGQGSTRPLLELDVLVDSDVLNSAYPIRVEFFWDGLDNPTPLGLLFVGSDRYEVPQAIQRVLLELPATVTGGTPLLNGRLTATAVDDRGNTSELSAPVVFGAPDALFQDSFEIAVPLSYLR
ncbi:MAG: right-handed parallel beta-helix repeat-containing protein [Pseudomonadota bacterium]